MKQVTALCAEEATPYVGEALRRLRAEVGNQAAVLGFVGAPFTLASYIVEGGSSSKYTHIKRLAFRRRTCCTRCWASWPTTSRTTCATRCEGPGLTPYPYPVHALLGKSADNIADYARFLVP